MCGGNAGAGAGMGLQEGGDQFVEGCFGFFGAEVAPVGGRGKTTGGLGAAHVGWWWWWWLRFLENGGFLVEFATRWNEISVVTMN